MEESKEKKVIRISMNKLILIIILGIVILSTISGIFVYNQKFSKENPKKQCIEETNKKFSDSKTGTIDPAKPVIYLYPVEKIEVTVKLSKRDNITCSYPRHGQNGWNVTAEPSGKLIDKVTGRELYCLYWEGSYTAQLETNEGYIIKGEDTIEFLEEKLAILGLNEKEAQEFIIYWLPQMEDNKYNYIRFETIDEINKNMPLEITPVPDNIIRINMQWKALDEHIKVEEQVLEKAPERTGFTVVEWGGTKLD